MPSRNLAGQDPTHGREFAGHSAVNRSIEEYVRGHFWHTNTVEGYFSILKRGITGIYQHCSQQHVKRYLGEFDFRYNHRVALAVDDHQRTEAALSGIFGKRLTYQTTGAVNGTVEWHDLMEKAGPNLGDGGFTYPTIGLARLLAMLKPVRRPPRVGTAVASRQCSRRARTGPNCHTCN